jgi:putative ABC transport system permease protein
MMQSIRERTAELAVLKAVGFGSGIVMTLILTEAIVFCLFSAAIGLGVASLLLPRARSLGELRGLVHTRAERRMFRTLTERC